MVSVGVAAAGVLLAAAATHRNAPAPSIDRLASRVERARVLPEETRQALRLAIQRTSQGAKASGIDDRNSAPAARIERAMQSKPTEATH
jgi:hypothetical protein